MFIDILRNDAFSQREKFLCLFGAVFAIMLSIMLHEIAHGYVALTQGDDTAKRYGRLTLNPVAHFDLFGFIMFLVIGIGWAKPVPIDPRNFKNYKKGTILVSVAGVVANFLLAAVSFALYVVFYRQLMAGREMNGVFAIFFYYFLNYSIVINLSLMAFNILPIPPLDGFRLIESFSGGRNRFCDFMYKYGSRIFFALIILGFMSDYLGLPLDFLGMYIGFVQNIVLRLFNAVGGLFV